MASKNNTTNSIDQTLKQFSKIMLTQKVFDCAICKKLLTPPVMIIKNTGNICSNCFKKTNEKKNAIRNEAFEKILDETVVPCDYGCKEDIVYKELGRHHAGCKCRPVRCLLQHCKQLHPINNYVKHFTENHPKQIFDNEDGIFLVNINISCNGCHLKLLKKKNNQFFLNVIISNTETIFFSIFTENINVSDNATKKCSIKLCGTNNTKVNIECEIQPLRNINDENKATKVSTMYLEDVIGSTIFVTLMIKSNENGLSNVFKKYMECPVCTEILRPPIYLCTAGHSICKNCQCKMSHCPTCRRTISKQSRNYCLEDMTKELLYECMYSANGCKGKLPGDQINQHEETCGFNNGQRYNTETNYLGSNRVGPFFQTRSNTHNRAHNIQFVKPNRGSTSSSTTRAVNQPTSYIFDDFVDDFW